MIDKKHPLDTRAIAEWLKELYRNYRPREKEATEEEENVGYSFETAPGTSEKGDC